MFKSITTRLIVLILSAVLPMIIAITFFSYKYASSLLIDKTKKEAELLLKNTEYRINMRTVPVQKIPAGLSANIGTDRAGLENMMLATLRDNREIYGIAAAFEPFAFSKDSENYCPYVYYENGEPRLTRLDTDLYDYIQQPWYTKPKLRHEPLWSEPYYDAGGGNILMSTYSYPLYRQSQFYGVITADITLAELSQLIRNIEVLETGYAFLVSSGGTVMVHPDKSLVMKESVLAVHNKEFLGIAESIRGNDKSADSRYTDTGDSLVWYKKIAGTDWYAGVVFPKSELFAPVTRLSYLLIIIGIICGGAMLVIVSFISRKVTGGMHNLMKLTDLIGKGKFDTPFPVQKGKDEMSRLSVSFEFMRQSLIEYMDELKTTENEKQKIESELSIAKDIQLGILPKPFEKRDDVELFAYMKPAKEVGGDLYDYYFLDDETLCFLIGDVSGKGVPAALFMAMSKTLIKASADKSVSAGDIFTKANRELAEGNDNCMFVTAFIGILNIKSGSLTYANAGHNPPMIISGEKVRMVESNIKPPLGAFDGAVYETFSATLAAGDRLFLYTDGVTEAMDKDDGLYGEKRLETVLSGLKRATVKETLDEVAADVDAYSRGVPQSDDITILCLSLK